ncbi:RadC family protein [Massilia sp.]|uniref:JAB domain-containing protein n=1 Tax=Massilia sp. TaxID=1882437 RepID=UPI00352F1CD4
MSTATVLECRDGGALADEVNQREREDVIISEALAIMQRRVTRTRYDEITGPADVKKLLILAYAQAEKEEFGVLWLDVKHRVLGREILGLGTLTQCSVYPREVVKAGIARNASRAILFHNHPSGVPEPSEADRLLTRKLVEALDLVDIGVADHIIVAGTSSYSFAEHGLI